MFHPLKGTPIVGPNYCRCTNFPTWKRNSYARSDFVRVCRSESWLRELVSNSSLTTNETCRETRFDMNIRRRSSLRSCFVLQTRWNVSLFPWIVNGQSGTATKRYTSATYKLPYDERSLSSADYCFDETVASVFKLGKAISVPVRNGHRFSSIRPCYCHRMCRVSSCVRRSPNPRSTCPFVRVCSVYSAR